MKAYPSGFSQIKIQLLTAREVNNFAVTTAVGNHRGRQGAYHLMAQMDLGGRGKRVLNFVVACILFPHSVIFTPYSFFQRYCVGHILCVFFF